MTNIIKVKKGIYIPLFRKDNKMKINIIKADIWCELMQLDVAECPGNIDCDEECSEKDK